MSDTGRAYVEKHSPYTGAMFLIHLRLGNIENDTYNHRLFIADENLAKLCRCSTKTVQRAKAQMVEDGFLRLLKPATGRRAAEYEFLFPDTSVDITPQPVDDDVENDEIGGHFVQPLEVFEDGIGGHFVRIGGHPVRIGGHFVPLSDSTPIYRNKEEIEGTKSILPVLSETGESSSESSTSKSKQGGGGAKPYEAEFQELWSLYPRKVGNKKAYTALIARIRAGASFAEIREGVSNYANARRGQDPAFTLHAATFWGPQERWKDYLDGAEGLKTHKAQPKGFSGIEDFLQRGE